MFDESDVYKAMEGDRHAFVKLIKSCEPTMYRVSKSILESDHDCADSMQEAIMKAFVSLQTLKKAKHFKTWLIRILINECYKIFNEKKKVTSVSDFTKIDINQSNVSSSYGIIDLVNFLSEDLRLAITLFYIEDLPLKEIAKLLGIPLGTVKSRLHRAKKELFEMTQSLEGGVYQ